MKKVLKLAVMLAIIICIQIPNSFVYATIDDIIANETKKAQNSNLIDPDEYAPASDLDDEFDEKLTDIAGTVLAVIRNIGIIVAVIALMVIGLRTMTASVEEKAVYKQALPGYILGVVMVVAVTVIPSIIYSVVQNWND